MSKVTVINNSPELAEALKKPAINVKEQLEIVTRLKSSLEKLKIEFPFIPLLNTAKGFVDPRGYKANMHNLVAILLADVGDYEGHLKNQLEGHKSQNSDIVEYNHFKGVVEYHLYEDPRGKNASKSNSPLYPVYYAIISLFRAFFRMFDVLIAAAKTVTGAKYQTKNDTPGYEPFFKLPEESTGKQAIALQQEFKKAILELDKLRGPEPEYSRKMDI